MVPKCRSASRAIQTLRGAVKPLTARSNNVPYSKGSVAVVSLEAAILAATRGCSPNAFWAGSTSGKPLRPENYETGTRILSVYLRFLIMRVAPVAEWIAETLWPGRGKPSSSVLLPTRLTQSHKRQAKADCRFHRQFQPRAERTSVVVVVKASNRDLSTVRSARLG